MKYTSSDIENNIFKQNMSGFHCGTPINILLQEQAATFQHGRFVVPKQHKRFQDLVAPNGLLIRNESMLQKGGGLTIKEINESIEELKKVCLAHGGFTASICGSWRCRNGSIGSRAIQGDHTSH